MEVFQRLRVYTTPEIRDGSWREFETDDGEVFQFDPRPDITADSAYWQSLLMTTRALERSDSDNPADNTHSLYGALHGLRCGGARLELNGGKLRLLPGDWGDEYRELREKWLVPHADQLRRLLASIGAMLAREVGLNEDN